MGSVNPITTAAAYWKSQSTGEDVNPEEIGVGDAIKYTIGRGLVLPFLVLGGISGCNGPEEQQNDLVEPETCIYPSVEEEPEVCVENDLYSVSEQETEHEITASVRWGGDIDSIQGTWQALDEEGSLVDEQVATFTTQDEGHNNYYSTSLYLYPTANPGNTETIILNVDVEGWDGAGTVAASQQASLLVYTDHQPEVVDFDSPYEGEEFFSDASVELHASVFDYEDALEDLAVLWTLDGEELADTVNSSGNTSFTTSLDEGTHTASICVTDSVPQTVCSETRTFDVVPPEACNDDDIDGDGISECDGDCDDDDATVYPGAPELCDGLDNDCDEIVDNNDNDVDGDGYTACEDCDDTNNSIYPGATELYDCVDNDCDGVVDNEVSLAFADASFTGEDIDSWAGWSVASAGDVNADGLADILIGARGKENDQGEVSAGEAYLIYGGGLSGNYDLGLSNASFQGENQYDYAGQSVSSAGDVNGDGFDDIFIGAYNNPDGGTAAGKAYLLYGGSLNGTINLINSDAAFVGESSGDSAGESVASAGDVNGDGFDDLLVGADNNDQGGDSAGIAYLILGSNSLYGTYDLGASHATLIGENSGDYAGEAVYSAGDVNGDGLDDVLIGARHNGEVGTSAGKVYLFFGPVTGEQSLGSSDAAFLGESSSDMTGGAVSFARDVNGDIFSDLLIGAVGNEDGGTMAGKAYVILGNGSLSGTSNLSSSDTILIGDSDDYAGDTLAAGDINGDNLDDLLIGASSSGHVYLVYANSLGGTNYLSSIAASFVNENSGELVGKATASAGDVDGDGMDDILIGAAGNDDAGYMAGKAYLIYGQGCP